MKSLREKLLAVAIAIVFVFFVSYGISTFIKHPKREDYCGDYRQYYNQEECEAAGGKWDDIPRPVVKENFVENITGWCNSQYTCQNEYNAVRKKYESTVTLIALIVGTLAFILAGSFVKLESISVGFMGGGLLSILYGVIRYWQYMEDFVRFVTLGLILVILVWFGYKKIANRFSVQKTRRK